MGENMNGCHGGSAAYCQQGLIGPGGQSFTSIVPGDGITMSVAGNVLTVAQIPEHYAQIQVYGAPGSWWTPTASLSALTAVGVLDARYTQQAPGALAVWDNQLGTNDAVQGTPARCPTLDMDAWRENGPAVAFTAASVNWMAWNGIAAAIAEPYAVVAVAQVPSIIPAAQGDLFSSSGTGAAVTQVYHEPGAGKLSVHRRDIAGGSVILSTSNAFPANVPVPLAAVFAGAGSFALLGETQTAMPTLGAGAIDYTVCTVGGYTASLNYQGLLRGLAIFKGAATPTARQCREIARQLNGQAFPRVVIEGDSMSVAGSWDGALAAYLGTGSVETHATSGNTAAQMVAQYPAEIAPRFTEVVPAVFVLWGGTNSIFFGATGEQTARDCFNELDLARTTGYVTIFLSIPPRIQFDATQEARRVMANAIFDIYARMHCDAYIPLHRMGPWTNYLSTMFSGDHIHPSAAGNDDIARMVAFATRSLVG